MPQPPYRTRDEGPFERRGERRDSRSDESASGRGRRQRGRHEPERTRRFDDESGAFEDEERFYQAPDWDDDSERFGGRESQQAGGWRPLQDWQQPRQLGGGQPGRGYGESRGRGYRESAGYGSYGESRGYDESRSYGEGRGSGETGRYTGRGPKNYQRSDQRIQEEICDRLTADPEVDASEIEVSVKDGEVTLEGTVDERGMKRAAEDCADDVSGVRQVHNRLRVQPRAAGADDEAGRQRGAGMQATGARSTQAGQQQAREPGRGRQS